jgi:hypothetical protein
MLQKTITLSVYYLINTQRPVAGEEFTSSMDSAG